MAGLVRRQSTAERYEDFSLLERVRLIQSEFGLVPCVWDKETYHSFLWRGLGFGVGLASRQVAQQRRP